MGQWINGKWSEGWLIGGRWVGGRWVGGFNKILLFARRMTFKKLTKRIQ